MIIEEITEKEVAKVGEVTKEAAQDSSPLHKSYRKATQ